MVMTSQRKDEPLAGTAETMETRPLKDHELAVMADDGAMARLSHVRSNIIALLASGLCDQFSGAVGAARMLLRVCNQIEMELLAQPLDGDNEQAMQYRQVIESNLVGLEVMARGLLEMAVSLDEDVAAPNYFSLSGPRPAISLPLAPIEPPSEPNPTPPRRRVLIVDDEHEIATLFSTYLTKRHGYEVQVLTDGRNVVEAARMFQPHLVLLDLMLPGVDGFALCRQLKSNRTTSSIPVVLLTAQGETDRLIRGIEAGADDYLLKPVHMAELHARLELVMQRLERARQASPLTGLPGNVIIEREVQSRIQNESRFAVCYSDLANFKAFNDTYGYVHGDRVLKWLAQTISAVIDELGEPSDFVGHVGGDDFIFITSPERVRAICDEIIARFDATIPNFYNEQDRKAGYIVANNRSNILTTFPIMTISIAVVTNDRRPLSTIAQVSEVSSGIKRYLKTRPGSHFMIDRRSTEDTPSTAYPLVAPLPSPQPRDSIGE